MSIDRLLRRLPWKGLSRTYFVLRGYAKRWTRSRRGERFANLMASTLPRNRRVGFVIVGAQKCGTSALAAYLERHPQTAMAWTKEVHYFDRDVLFAPGIQDVRHYHGYFKDVGSDRVYGEASPSYMAHPFAMQRMAAYHPGLKLIALLRNPADRAFSQWNMYNQGVAVEQFRRDLEQELKSEADGLASEPHRRGYLRRGRYGEQLSRMFEQFPREQVLVIKYERFLEHNVEVLHEVCAFIGIAPPGVKEERKAHVLPYSASLPREDRRWMMGLFEPQIRAVEEELGWDCSDWRQA